jgi:uncharacterized protein (TIGR00266 family)
MNTPLYEVVITGELEEGSSLETVVPALANLFKVSHERAAQILQTAPKAIKSGLDEMAAKKYQEIIQKLGVKVSLKSQEPVAGLQEPSDSVQATSETPELIGLSAQSASPVRADSMVKVDMAAPVNFQGYHFSIQGRPDFAFLKVQIPANQALKVEASAMATMDTHLQMKTKMRGGLSRLLTSESIFINEFTAAHSPGEIGIAPASPGDLMHRYLNGESIYLQNSAFVACHPNVNIETKWQGLTKGFFSGESLFLIRANGVGDLWFNSYGAIMEIDVEEGYVVDTGNIVAFTDGLEYSISKVGGYKSLFFSGEGLVCRFKGKGKVWIQTRSVGGMTSWAHIYRPVKKK